jgi:hypothetical protein
MTANAKDAEFPFPSVIPVDPETELLHAQVLKPWKKYGLRMWL